VKSRKRMLPRIQEEESEEEDASDESEVESDEEEEQGNGNINQTQSGNFELQNSRTNNDGDGHNTHTPKSSTPSSDDDSIEVVEHMSKRFDAITVSDYNGQDNNDPATIQTQHIKEDRHILPALTVLATLPHDRCINVFKAAFPQFTDHEVNKFNFRDPAEIKAVWYLHRERPHMFTLEDALTSPDSPLSPSYVPRLLMFHRMGFFDRQ
jgi:hypothetical protein